MTAFTRRPPAHPPALEVVVETADTGLSGLLATPGDVPPKALVVAVHGSGMHAGYWHASAAPGLSLLEAGAARGFTVWAPDRPGHGASSGLPGTAVGLFDQARILLDGIDAFAAAHPVGGGVLLVGHSYGLKVAFTMAAETRGAALLGLDGSGSGLRYAFTPGTGVAAAEPGDHGPSWGPGELYPPETFERRRLPLHRVPPSQSAEAPRWPDDFRAMAPRIRVPVRLTFGAHDRFWHTDEDHFSALRSLLTGVPSLEITVEPDAGHNLSLGWSAERYHGRVLDFAEACLRARRQVAAGDCA